MGDGPTAAVRYKEIIGLAREAAEELRGWELARADELSGLIEAAKEQLAAARQREESTTERANRWWNMATDNVKRLSWLDPGPPPEPVTSARGERLDRYADEIRDAYRELADAVMNLSWRAR